jgi:hypothetical protein
MQKLKCSLLALYFAAGKGLLPPVHCKKSLAIFRSPAGMSFTKLSLGGNI